jgi:hypothetical protein
MTMVANAPRSISAIAADITKDWKKVNFAAVPYLNAMKTLDKITDVYYADDGQYIVTYFLANAGSWRGDTAKAIKAELKKLAGVK